MSRYLDVKKALIIIFYIAVYARLEALPLENDSCSHPDSTQTNKIELDLLKVLESFTKGCTIIGVPLIIDCPYGKAVQFDGQNDAMILDTNPMVNMYQFTLEVIMRPDTNGQREQRFLHFGEVRGERVMIETRLTKDDQWYLDTYMKSGQTGQTLADSTRLHPLNQWYHIAFVVNEGKMEAYVNGSKELEGQIPFSPFTKGQSSVGVRLNRVNWYKGAIYKIKITPMKLEPVLFMKY
jgi:hypothetical protein